jgi:hypothetical protein
LPSIFFTARTAGEMMPDLQNMMAGKPALIYIHKA